MYLIHSGIVRQTAKAQIRNNNTTAPNVTGTKFSYDTNKVAAAIENIYHMEGIYYIKTWINEGRLWVGDDII